MSAADFRVQVSILATSGVKAWDVTPDEAAPLWIESEVAPPTPAALYAFQTAGTALEDGLSISRSMPEADISPLQPNAAECRFSVVAATPDELTEAVDIGTPVRIAYYSPADAATPTETFHGRISDVVVNPHPLGARFNFTCVDYLADLAEITLQPSDITHTGHTGVVDDIFDAAGLGYARARGVTFNPDVWQLPTDAFNMREVLDQLFLQWIQYYDDIGFARYYLRQKIGTAGTYLDATTPYTWQLFNRVAPESGLVIPANQVDVVGAFTLRKYAVVDKIYVKYTAPGGAVSVTTSTPPYTWRASTVIECTGDTGAATQTEQFYKPTTAERAATKWVADAFTWHLKAAAPGAYLPGLYQYVTIDGIDERWCPLGATYRGVVSAYTLTIQRARPVLTFELRNAIPA